MEREGCWQERAGPRPPRQSVVGCHEVPQKTCKCHQISGDSGINQQQQRHQVRPSAPPEPAQCHLCYACHAKATWSATPAKQDKRWEEGEREGGREARARREEGRERERAGWTKAAGATRQDSMEREGCRQEWGGPRRDRGRERGERGARGRARGGWEGGERGARGRAGERGARGGERGQQVIEDDRGQDSAWDPGKREQLRVEALIGKLLEIKTQFAVWCSLVDGYFPMYQGGKRAGERAVRGGREGARGGERGQRGWVRTRGRPPKQSLTFLHHIWCGTTLLENLFPNSVSLGLRMGAVGFTAAGLGGVRPGGASVVLRWCLLGVSVVFWWFSGCLEGVTLVSSWSLAGLWVVSCLSLAGLSLVSRSSLSGLLLVSCWIVADLLLICCWFLAGFLLVSFWSLVSLLLDSFWSLAGLSVVSCRRHARVLLWFIAFIGGCFCLLLFHRQRCETAMISHVFPCFLQWR